MNLYSSQAIRLSATGTMLLLAGCASIPADRGAAASSALVKSHSSIAHDLKLQTPSDEQINALLAEPLSADDAARLALLKNPRMRALYADLGLAQADVYDASRLSNPSLGYISLTPRNSDEQARTTWSLTQSFTELLFLHYRTSVSRSQLLQVQQRVAHEVLSLEADVRVAHYRYVAATLIAQLYEQLAFTANASSDYAQSLFDAGNINELQLNREQANASDLRIAAHAARSDALRAKSELLTLIGLPLDDSKSNAQFVERLDVPLRLQLNPAELRNWADAQRIDLTMMREQIKLFASVKTHTGRWRWIGGLELQAEKEHETDGTELRGLGGSIDLPIFNQGGGNMLRARSQLEAAQANLQALQLGIANNITVQATALDNAWQRVDEYRQKLVPLREHIVALSQQHQNFMLIGAFETLAAKHDALVTYQAYLNAVGDYWVQYAELARTAGGRLPDSSGSSSVGVSVGVDALAPSDDEGHADTQTSTQTKEASHDHDASTTSHDSTGGTP